MDNLYEAAHTCISLERITVTRQEAAIKVFKFRYGTGENKMVVSLTAEARNTLRKVKKNLTPLSQLRANDRGVKRSKVSAKDRKAAKAKLLAAGLFFKVRVELTGE